MISFITKFIGTIKDFFGTIFSLPSTISSFVTSSFGIFSFLGEDVVTFLIAIVGVVLAFLVITTIVRLVSALL